MIEERDPVLGRIERDALIACAAMAAAAVCVASDRLAAAAGVVGGGALAAISYGGIKAGIDAVLAPAENPEKRRKQGAAGLVKFFTRYAILAAVAYVIMARLRLPPVAVVAGASSLVIAIALQAVRPFRANPRQHP